MSTERLLILKMVSEGKLSADEADRLLAAIQGEPARKSSNGNRSESPQDFLQRAADELKKGFQDFGAVASDELQKFSKKALERSQTLRTRLEEMRRNAQSAPGKKRQHTITIEVEEDKRNRPEDPS